ncbi:hypothetical protein IQ06DRAFT_204402, partial [Phaeosphaeriaceae sp. SRC1lsM3a]
MVIDKIAAVAEQTFQDRTWQEALPHLRLFAKIDEDLDKPYTSRQKAFWKTLAGGIFLVGLHNHAGEHEVYFHRIRGEHEHMYRAWLDWCELGSSHLNRDAETFGHAVMAASSCRQFILTEKGYIGWANEECKVGDEIVLMPGGLVPYILRPCTQGVSDDIKARLCTFIGDAYVHGVMDGQAWIESDEMKSIIILPRDYGDNDDDNDDD